MKITKKSNPSKGFVLVASKKFSFFIAAKNLAENILDYIPDAKVTLFTEQHWIDKHISDLDHFDQVLPTISNGIREKMYGMANTPYDLTLYLDCDIEIHHQDIDTIFDQIDDDTDMMWVRLTKKGARVFAEWNWGDNLLDNGYEGPPDHLSHCGGVCLYDTRNPLIKEFMTDWYSLYYQQRDNSWMPEEFKNIPNSFKQWDQLTLWWLLWHSPKYKSITWKFFKENYRWNYYTSFGFPWNEVRIPMVDKEPIIVHHSRTMDKEGTKGYLTHDDPS